MPPITITPEIIIGVAGIVIVVAAAVGIISSLLSVKKGYKKGIAENIKVGEEKIRTADEEAQRIIADAKEKASSIVKEGESKKKESLIEAKEEILRQKNENEKHLNERRNEVSRLEKRVQSKEENLDRKLASIEKKEEQLNEKVKENEEKTEEIEKLKAQEIATLEKLAGLTAIQAKDELLTRLENEVRHDAAMKIIEIETELRDNADQKAKDIISMAIQRCAADHTSESTISVVSLPSDDMKGRIIGREGRNIRTIETLTGVDLIIDDTPEAITISCFDPIRREVARLTLEKLIADGRIHPSKIEEMVEKSRKEVDAQIKSAGEEAVIAVGIHSISNELIKILGRLKFRTSYGQNVLKHSIEVAYIAGMMADELGVDSTLAKRAGLLHDIGKAMTQEVEGSHVQIGVDIARRFKENGDVIHAIEAHHNDVEPQSIIAILVQAADAISAARPGARREDLENYIKRLQKLEEISTSFDGVEKAYAIQAGREIRIMVNPTEIFDEQMVIVARDIVKKIEEEMEYPGQIKINVIRESRVVDIAK